MVEKLLVLLFLATVAAAISATVSRASLFDGLRDGLARKSDFLGKLVSCPYCLSHWVAFGLVAAYRPQVLPVHWTLNFLAASFSIVTLTAFLVGGMFAAFQHIPPPKGEPEPEEEDAA